MPGLEALTIKVLPSSQGGYEETLDPTNTDSLRLKAGSMANLRQIRVIFQIVEDNNRQYAWSKEKLVWIRSGLQIR